MIKTEYPFGKEHADDCIVSWTPDAISIDRSEPIDPVKLYGEGWGVAEQDDRSLSLDKVDLTKVLLQTCLREEEVGISGEEKIDRLKQMGQIRLDAQILLTLHHRQLLGWIPDCWKEKRGGEVAGVSFDGTIFRGPNNERYVLFLIWDERQNLWQKILISLQYGMGANALSAVLPLIV